MKHEKVFLVTDGCAWEINKQAGNEHPHSIEVVDMETGAVRYIKSGSRIALIEGQITDVRTQEAYNKATTEKAVSSDRKGMQQRAKSEKGGREQIK